MRRRSCGQLRWGPAHATTCRAARQRPRTLPRHIDPCNTVTELLLAWEAAAGGDSGSRTQQPPARAHETRCARTPRTVSLRSTPGATVIWAAQFTTQLTTTASARSNAFMAAPLRQSIPGGLCKRARPGCESEYHVGIGRESGAAAACSCGASEAAVTPTRCPRANSPPPHRGVLVMRSKATDAQWLAVTASLPPRMSQRGRTAPPRAAGVTRPAPAAAAWRTRPLPPRPGTRCLEPHPACGPAAALRAAWQTGRAAQLPCPSGARMGGRAWAGAHERAHWRRCM